MRKCVSLSIVVTTMFVAILGRANMAAPIPPEPSKLAGPQPLAKTPLVVEDERLVFDCYDDEPVPRCRFEARYRIHNPTEQTVGLVAAFVAVDTPQVEITVDGRPAHHALTPEEREALSPMARRVKPREARGDEEDEPNGEVTLHGLELQAPAGATVVVVAVGVTEPGLEARQPQSYNPYVLSGNYTRHLWLGTADGENRDLPYHFEYLIAPIHSWGAVGPIHIEVRYPQGWKLRGALRTPQGLRQFEDVPDEDNRAVLDTSGDEGGTMLSMVLVEPGSDFLHGGPVVAAGKDVSEGGGFRMRFGYEVAAPGWLIYSLNADTDFQELFVLAPVVEAAAPQLVFLPSLSLGVGIPVRILPEQHVGLRAQAGLNLWAAGFVTSVDWYPSAVDGGDPRRVDVSLMGRVSL